MLCHPFWNTIFLIFYKLVRILESSMGRKEKLRKRISSTILIIDFCFWLWIRSRFKKLKSMSRIWLCINKYLIWICISMIIRMLCWMTMILKTRSFLWIFWKGAFMRLWWDISIEILLGNRNSGRKKDFMNVELFRELLSLLKGIA